VTVVPAGTVGIVSTRGLELGIVRLGTRSHWNHVVIATGRGTLVEAQPGGVREIPDNWYLPPSIVWLIRQPLTDAQRISIVEFVDSAALERLPYNWPAIIVFALQTFLPWLPHGWLDRWADNRRNVICSELAVDAQRAAGVPEVFPDALGATVSPGALDVAFRLAGW
jgi:hypothetical protein